MEVSSGKNSIVLTTFNAKYIHTSIGLRYLLANLKDLKQASCILEFGINDNISQTAERILSSSPHIVGIGVYIWNALQVSELISTIKKVSPMTKVILGGPEVSHLPFRIDFSQADYIIQGEGEVTFYKLCKALIDNSSISEEKIIRSETPEIEEIELPYRYYTDKDIKDRIIYVEASRGCPFRCEFCLSSIDKKVRYFDLDKLLQEIELLWQKGARSFKFIDRTFNLRSGSTNQILDYFLKKVPARWTQVSSPPYNSTAVSAARFTCSGCVTSAATNTARPPDSRISLTSSSSGSAERPDTTTLAPR